MQSAIGAYPAIMNNSFLDTFWEKGNWSNAGIEQAHDVVDVTPLNPYASFTPARQGQYVYVGSLTVPPCSGPVQWFVYDEPVMVSSLLNGVYFSTNIAS